MRNEGHSSDSPRTRYSHRHTAFETALIVGGLALFLVLLYEMQTPDADGGFLNPPLLAVAGMILLWPLRRHRLVRPILLSGGFLVTLWLLDKLKGVLLPFVLVYMLAYLFDPIVGALRKRWSVPRWVSSLFVTALSVGFVSLFVLLLVPNIVGQVEVLGTRLLGSLGDLRAWLLSSTLLDNLELIGIDKAEFAAQVTTMIQEQLTALTGNIPDATQMLFRSIGSLLSVLVVVTITPVLLFYTLKDYPLIKRRLIKLFPTFGGRRDYVIKSSGVVGNYLRGQLIISAIAAFNVSLLLFIFGVPFALLIGILGGLLNMIPNIGIIITNIVGVLLAVIFGDPWLVKAVIVVAVLLLQSLLESMVLTPNILSYHVGLHPVLIILSLFIFGSFLGLFGLLIAVPATALLQMGYMAYQEELTPELGLQDATGEVPAWSPDNGGRRAVEHEGEAR